MRSRTLEDFSQTEFNVLSLWVGGVPMKTSSDLLNKSRRTVETTVQRAKLKYEINTKHDAIKLFYENNLLEAMLTNAFQLMKMRKQFITRLEGAM